ncbi:MAG: response regulator [Calditrichaeota bacterium]|nr:response regulator [Calditrichota bacterium]
MPPPRSHRNETVANRLSQAAASNPSVATKEVAILIVDDEESARESLSEALHREGYPTVACPDFDSAVSALKTHSFPVVIVDIHLPGTDGIALLSHIRRLQTNTQCVMVTGDPSVATARESIRLGAYDYISKPFQRSELLTAVERAMEHYRLLQEKARLEKENVLYQQALEQMIERRTGQLRESQERYHLLFHRAIDAIFLLDLPTGTVRDLNLAASRLVGLPAEEIIGRPFQQYVVQQLHQAFRDIAKGKQDDWHADDLHFQRNNGEVRRVQLSVGSIELQEQKVLQVICRDITEKQAMEERQRQMEMELLSEQRLAAIGLMASGIAHNISSPLMAIYGMAQLLKMKVPDSDEVDGILSQVERVHQIVRNMMWKSRQEQEKSVQELDLSQLLREELKFLEADLEYKHNVEKEFHLSPDLPRIQGVYNDFSQALMNIVRNALDAMWDRPERKLRISTSLVGEDIVIEIEDTGCGIPANKLDEIFSPFYTTKPLVGKQKEPCEPTGTGLGLSIARRLLEPYGVRSHIESTVGTGTKFTLLVPIRQSPPS